MTRPTPPPSALGLTRADLDALPSYVPGRNPADLARELGLPEAIKLASNEVPYGPLPGVVEAVTEAVAGDTPLPGHGRAGAAGRAGRAVRGRRRTGSPPAAGRWRSPSTWSGPPACPATRSSTRGAPSRRTRSSRRPAARPACGCPTTPAHGHDLAAMAAAVTDRTRLIFVCNPNNPTGTAVRRAELDRFLDAVPDDVLVVLDEAYREFVTDPEVPDGLAAYGDRPNVVVLRTLSKAWGLAGLRVGFLVAQPRGGRRGPQGGHPVLHQPGRPGRGAGRARAGRRGAPPLRAGGRRAGAGHRGAAQAAPAADGAGEPGELRLVAAGRPGGARSPQACEARGVIVRPFAGDGVRVTIGTPDENDAFLAAAESAR